jgi:hypothetical protein
VLQRKLGADADPGADERQQKNLGGEQPCPKRPGSW